MPCHLATGVNTFTSAQSSTERSQIGDLVLICPLGGRNPAKAEGGCPSDWETHTHAARFDFIVCTSRQPSYPKSPQADAKRAVQYN